MLHVQRLQPDHCVLFLTSSQSSKGTCNIQQFVSISYRGPASIVQLLQLVQRVSSGDKGPLATAMHLRLRQLPLFADNGQAGPRNIWCELS